MGQGIGARPAVTQKARVQESLWHKNFVCATRLNRQSDNYAAIVGEQVTVVAWACPSGDVLVTVEPSTDAAPRRSVWIPMIVSYQKLSLLDLVLPEALAAPGTRLVRKRSAPLVTVLCQKWRSDRFIQRRIQLANGKCFDEVINPRTGRVVKIKKASCKRNC